MVPLPAFHVPDWQSGKWTASGGGGSIATCSAAYLTGKAVGTECAIDGRLARSIGTVSGRLLVTTLSYTSSGYRWGCFATVTGATSLSDSKGNTDTILAADCFHFPEIRAVLLCRNIGPEWSLPARDDLQALYDNRVLIGGFTDAKYWSSTEANQNTVWALNFGNGFWDGLASENKAPPTSYHVRCVRSF